MEALLDPILTFYRQCLERLEERFDRLRVDYENLLMERRSLMRSYERLEEWGVEQESRLNALREVFDRVIAEATANTRAELLHAFTEVQRENEIELDNDLIDALESDTESFEIGSVGSLDDMFN